MALMERIATLLRANVNDLIDRAEDPEKMLKQLVLDMENQLLQLKTQVAIALADQHLLEARRSEQETLAAEWKRKAELAVEKGQDDLARAALERSLSHTGMMEGFARQAAEQKAEAEALRSTYGRLEGKLKETEGHCEMMVARARRARTVSRAHAAHEASGAVVSSRRSPLERLKAQVQTTEAENHAGRTLLEGETLSGDTLEHRFATLEKGQQVDRLLEELKQKQRMLPAS